jgi:aminoglycoside phosphotransferase family enzyme
MCRWFFLPADRGYKLKRAIKFPYLDFASAEPRRIACEAKLVLNRRTAPELLEVRALTRTANGRVSFGTEDRVVDWVVGMRRFDQATLFDELAKTNRLNSNLMNDLADHIAAFHQAAESRPSQGGAAALAAVVETNDCCLMAASHAGFSDRWSGSWTSEPCSTVGARPEKYAAATGTCISATFAHRGTHYR